MGVSLVMSRRDLLGAEPFGAVQDNPSTDILPVSRAFAPGLQTTLRQQVHCFGVGLHCGRLVNLTLKPATPGTGLRFFRRDVAPGKAWIQGRWDAVSDTMLCTTISNAHGVSVATVEHLVAALAAAGVDNVIVELDAPEPPAMDGSAEPFSFLIECAGIVSQPAERSMLRILKEIRVEDGSKYAVFSPGSGTTMDVTIDFDSPAIGRQRIALDLTGMRFKAELARARTFGFAHEVAHLQSKGLARGGSLENAVVIQNDAILNPGGLRFPDEFVRHKALDAVGDLYLAGGPFIGRYTAEQPGHKLNSMLLHALLSDPEAFAWTNSAHMAGNAKARAIA